MPLSHNAQIRDTLAGFLGGLVVACHARPGNPLHGSGAMALMAQAAELGGASALRVNGPEDTRAVLATTSLPVIAANRTEHPGSQVAITPTIASAASLIAAGAGIIALDATDRPRPNRETLRDVVSAIHQAGGVALGDLSRQADLEGALAADIDAVGSTLSGYTGGPISDEPDFDLLAWLVKRSPVPVFAQGRYWNPDQVTRAFGLGASFVVVGQAITNPMAITSRFRRAIDDYRQHNGNTE